MIETEIITALPRLVMFTDNRNSLVLTTKGITIHDFRGDFREVSVKT